MGQHSKATMRVQARKKGGQVKSSFEANIVKQLDSVGINYSYEDLKLPYIKAHNYVPDFILKEQAIIVETKGLFDLDDRSKMIVVKKTYPELDIRILFQNKNTKIKKGSSTTYEDWCNKYGFICASGKIPDDWLNHKPSKEQIKALEEVYKRH